VIGKKLDDHNIEKLAALARKNQSAREGCFIDRLLRGILPMKVRFKYASAPEKACFCPWDTEQEEENSVVLVDQFPTQ
jgi:hypothetical protein